MIHSAQIPELHAPCGLNAELHVIPIIDLREIPILPVDGVVMGEIDYVSIAEQVDVRLSREGDLLPVGGLVTRRCFEAHGAVEDQENTDGTPSRLELLGAYLVAGVGEPDDMEGRAIESALDLPVEWNPRGLAYVRDAGLGKYCVANTLPRVIAGEVRWSPYFMRLDTGDNKGVQVPNREVTAFRSSRADDLWSRYYLMDGVATIVQGRPQVSVERR